MGLRDKKTYTTAEQLAMIRKLGNPAAADDIGNTVEIATSDLRQVAKQLRNIAQNIRAANAFERNSIIDRASEIEDVINLLEGNAQHP